MQSLVVIVIDLAAIAWLSHVTIEAIREHRRSSDDWPPY